MCFVLVDLNSYVEIKPAEYLEVQEHLPVDAREEDVPELAADRHCHVILRQEIDLEELYDWAIVEVPWAHSAVAQEAYFVGFAPIVVGCIVIGGGRA